MLPRSFNHQQHRRWARDRSVGARCRDAAHERLYKTIEIVLYATSNKLVFAQITVPKEGGKHQTVLAR